jgi:hypothetical protein
MNDLFIQAVEWLIFVQQCPQRSRSYRSAVRLEPSFRIHLLPELGLSNEEVHGSIEVRAAKLGIRVGGRVMGKNQNVLKRVAGG